MEWLAAQPWCNGNVGMWGISYGGFTAIQVAKARPPHAQGHRAHVRHRRPLHGRRSLYRRLQNRERDGPVRGQPGGHERAAAQGRALRDSGGEDWATTWRTRLEETPPWTLEWLRQQTDGPYWRRGSLAPDYDAITCAMLLIGGWNDGYTNPVLRMLERCTQAPRRAIIGNWVHALPSAAYPGPNLDWLHEMVRFFDYWLKEIDNGVMDEPMLTYLRREYTEPAAFPKVQHGTWQSETVYPASRAEVRTLYLDEGALAPEISRTDAADCYPAPAHAGHACQPLLRRRHGAQRPGPRPASRRGAEPDLYQRAARRSRWTCSAFPKSCCTCASPRRRPRRRAPDRRRAGRHVGAGGHGRPQPDPSRRPRPSRSRSLRMTVYPVRGAAQGDGLSLSARPASAPQRGQRVVARHLAVAPRGRQLLASRSRVPVTPGTARAAAQRQPLAPPAFKTTPPELLSVGSWRGEPPVWEIVEDVMRQAVTVRVRDGDETTLPDGVVIYTAEELEMTAYHHDPAHAMLHNRVVYRLDEHGYATEVRAQGAFRSDATHFYFDLQLEVYLNAGLFFRKSWLETVARA